MKNSERYPEWKCPKCGAMGDNIECTEFVLGEKLPDGLHKTIPTRIWCVICKKEYRISGREVVQFT